MASTSRKDAGESGASPLTGDALDERIAKRAYELYCARGQRHGDDLKDWYEAEQLVLTEQRARAQTKAPRPRAKGLSAGREARLETGRPV